LSLSRLKLATRRDVERRVGELVEFYRETYGSALFIGERTYYPRELVLTQSHIESDKLGLVLRSVLFEAYRVPIIVVTGEKNKHYVVDGHHRVIVYSWLDWRIPGYTIIVPGYKPRIEKNIIEVESINPQDTPIELSCWRHIVNTIRFFEKQYGILARVWLENLRVAQLKPTEPPIRDPSPHPSSQYCPILVYKYISEYYVVDGHHRVCFKLVQGENTIQSIVFTLENQEVGLIKTARRLGHAYFTLEYCGKPVK